MTMLLPMVIFAMIASITPGPVNLIATSAAASFGYQRTIPHILGASIGFSLILILLGLGLSAGLSGFMADNPSTIHFLTATGSVFLIYTAYKIALAPMGVDGKNLSAPPKFLSGLLCQWLNPKAWVVAVSGIAVFVPEGGVAMIYFVMAFFGSCLVSISAWALMGLSIQGLLKNPAISRSFNRTMGGLLAALVVYILL
jgi:threonine/homoserine/homoserine lactone efflux protein